MEWQIFCDFDGTVAQNDVGNLVFTKFGDETHWWQLVQQWREKKIHACEMWRRQAALSRMPVDQLDRFAAGQPIDSGFADFVRFCRENHWPVTIVSDGMDAYIRRILDRHGLTDLEVRSNRLYIDDEGRLEVDFPYFAEGCGSCANCKGYHLRQARMNGAKTVYVGDGYSDLCALPEADLLFAKDDLLIYCRDHNVPCIPFHTFHHVQNELIHRLT